jgi:hypothetical protein
MGWPDTDDRQNPHLPAGMTSPAGGPFEVPLRKRSEASEGDVFIADARHAAVLRAALDTYRHRTQSERRREAQGCAATAGSRWSASKQGLGDRVQGGTRPG